MSFYWMLRKEIWKQDLGTFMSDITPYPPTTKQLELLSWVKILKKRILVCSGNGTGKTLCLAVLALWCALVLAEIMNKPIKVFLVSGSWRQAHKLHSFIDEFREHPYIIDNIRGEPTKTAIHFKNRSWIKTVTGSEKQVLGEHPDVYFLDEAVLLEDWVIDDIYARVSGQKPGIVILTSTPEVEHYFSKFIDIWNDEKEYSEWKRLSWSWFDCPWKTLEEIEEAKKRSSKDKFDAKVRGIPSFNPKGTLFNIDKLRKDVRVKKTHYDKDSSSTLGIDFGVRHPTVMTVWQKEKEIWYMVHGEDWTEKSRDYIMNRIKLLVEKYNVSQINADAAIPWLIRDVQDLRTGAKVKGVNFRGALARMQFGLQSLIENDNVKIPEKYTRAFQELAIYTIDSKQNKDWVDSIMLGVYEAYKPRSIWYFRIGSERKRRKTRIE